MPFGASTSLLYLSIYIICSTPTRKPQMSIIPNAMSYLLPTYREVLLSNIICTVEVQQLFTTFLSSRNRSLGSAWILLQVENGVVEGVESLSSPEGSLSRINTSNTMAKGGQPTVHPAYKLLHSTCKYTKRVTISM